MANYGALRLGARRLHADLCGDARQLGGVGHVLVVARRVRLLDRKSVV